MHAPFFVSATDRITLPISIELEAPTRFGDPTIEDVQRLTRIQVCARCAFRCPHSRTWDPNAARPCEESCPLFKHLPVFREGARQLDPMLAERPRAIEWMVDELIPGRTEKANVLRDNGRLVAEGLDRLFRN